MIDLPFGSEDAMVYAEPDCYTCEDSGWLEQSDGRMLPCPDCQPDAFDHAVDCGSIEP